MNRMNNTTIGPDDQDSDQNFFFTYLDIELKKKSQHNWNKINWNKRNSQCWTLGERVVQLVASLTGPAENMLIGMTMGQLDDYTFLVARLSRRYDPPEREEAHRAVLRTRTRRRNETADEFAENLKHLAQRAYTNADQSMLDNLVVERFREGHGNVELKKHLCLYPSNGLQDLIGVRFETHVELGTRAHKSNEGLYTVQGINSTDLTLEEVTRAARILGYALRPWVDRQQGNRGFNNGGPSRYQNGGNPQQGPKFNQNGNSAAITQNPVRRQNPIGEVKCWTCGKTGHYASDCKTNGPKCSYAPKVVRMNYLQNVSTGFHLVPLKGCANSWVLQVITEDLYQTIQQWRNP